MNNLLSESTSLRPPTSADRSPPPVTPSTHEPSASTSSPHSPLRYQRIYSNPINGAGSTNEAADDNDSPHNEGIIKNGTSHKGAGAIIHTNQNNNNAIEANIQTLSGALAARLSHLTATLKTLIEGKDEASLKNSRSLKGSRRRRQPRRDEGSSGSSNSISGDVNKPPLTREISSDNIINHDPNPKTLIMRDVSTLTNQQNRGGSFSSEGIKTLDELVQCATAAWVDHPKTITVQVPSIDGGSSNVAEAPYGNHTAVPMHPTLEAYADLLFEALTIALRVADSSDVQLDPQVKERIAIIQNWGAHRSKSQPTTSNNATAESTEIRNMHRILAAAGDVLMSHIPHARVLEVPTNGGDSSQGANTSIGTELITPLPSSIAVPTRSDSRQTDSALRFSSSSASPVRPMNLSDDSRRQGSTPLDGGNVIGTSSGRLTSSGGHPALQHYFLNSSTTTWGKHSANGGGGGGQQRGSSNSATTTNNSSADQLMSANSSTGGIAYRVGPQHSRNGTAGGSAQLHAHQTTPTPSRSDSSGAGYLAENEPRSSSEEKQSSLRVNSTEIVGTSLVPISSSLPYPVVHRENSHCSTPAPNALPQGEDATKPLQLAVARFFAQNKQSSKTASDQPIVQGSQSALVLRGHLVAQQDSNCSEFNLKEPSLPTLEPLSKEDTNREDAKNSRSREKSSTEDTGSSSTNGIPVAGYSSNSLLSAKPPMGRNLSVGSSTGIQYNRAAATQQGQLPPTSYPPSRRGSQAYPVSRSPVRGEATLLPGDEYISFGLPLHPYTIGAPNHGWGGVNSFTSSAPNTLVGTPPAHMTTSIEALWHQRGRADSTATRRESNGIGSGDNLSFISLLAPGGADFGTRRNSEVGLVEVVTVENRLQTPLIRSIIANIAQQRLSVPDLLASYPPLGTRALTSPTHGPLPPPRQPLPNLVANPLAIPPSSSIGSVGAQSATTMPTSSELGGEGALGSSTSGSTAVRNPLGLKAVSQTQLLQRVSPSVTTESVPYQQAPTIYSNNSTTNNNSHSGTSYTTAFSAAPGAHQAGTPRSPPLFAGAPFQAQPKINFGPTQPTLVAHSHFVSAASPLNTSAEYNDKTPPLNALTFVNSLGQYVTPPASPHRNAIGEGHDIMHEGTATDSSSRTRSSIVVGTGQGLYSGNISYSSFVRQSSVAVTTGTSASATSLSRRNPQPILSLAVRIRAKLQAHRLQIAKTVPVDDQAPEDSNAPPVVRTATIAERTVIVQPALMGTESTSSSHDKSKTPPSGTGGSGNSAPTVLTGDSNPNSLWEPVPLAPQYLRGEGVVRSVENQTEVLAGQSTHQKKVDGNAHSRETSQFKSTVSRSRLLNLGDDCFGNSPNENASSDPSSTKTSLTDNAIGNPMAINKAPPVSAQYHETSIPFPQDTFSAAEGTEWTDPTSFSTKDLKDLSLPSQSNEVQTVTPLPRRDVHRTTVVTTVTVPSGMEVSAPTTGPLGPTQTAGAVSTLGGSESNPNSLCFTEATSAGRALASQPPISTPSTVISGTMPTSQATPSAPVSSPTLATSPRQSSMETRPLLSVVEGHTIRRVDVSSTTHHGSSSVAAASSSLPNVHPIVGSSNTTPTQPLPPTELIPSIPATTSVEATPAGISSTNSTKAPTPSEPSKPSKKTDGDPLNKVPERSAKHLSMSSTSNMATDGNNTSFAALGNSVLSWNQLIPRRTGSVGVVSPRPNEVQADVSVAPLSQQPTDNSHSGLKPSFAPPTASGVDTRASISPTALSPIHHTAETAQLAMIPTSNLTSSETSLTVASKAAKPAFHHLPQPQLGNQASQLTAANSSAHTTAGDSLTNVSPNTLTTLASVIQYIHDYSYYASSRSIYEARSSGSHNNTMAVSAVTSMSEAAQGDGPPSIQGNTHHLSPLYQNKMGLGTPPTSGTNSTATSQDHHSSRDGIDGHVSGSTSVRYADPRSFVAYVMRAYELAKLDPMNINASRNIAQKQRKGSTAAVYSVATADPPYCNKPQLFAPSQLPNESKARVNEYLDTTELNITRFIPLDRQAESLSQALQLPFFPFISPMTPNTHSNGSEETHGGGQNPGDSHVLRISGQTLSAEETQDLSFPKFELRTSSNQNKQSASPTPTKDVHTSYKDPASQGNPLVPSPPHLPEEQTIIVPESMPASPTSRRSKASSGKSGGKLQGTAAPSMKENTVVGSTNTNVMLSKPPHSIQGPKSPLPAGVTPTPSTSFVFAPIVTPALGSDTQSEHTSATRNPTSPIQGITIKKVTSSTNTPIPLTLPLQPHPRGASVSDLNPSCSSLPYPATTTATGLGTPSNTVTSAMAERSEVTPPTPIPTTEGDSSRLLSSAATAGHLLLSISAPPVFSGGQELPHPPPDESPLLLTNQTPGGSPPLPPNQDISTPSACGLPTMLLPQKGPRHSNTLMESSSSNPKSLSRSAAKEQPTLSRSGIGIGREELQASASNTNQDSQPRLSITDAPFLTHLAQYADKTIASGAGNSNISVDSPPASFPQYSGVTPSRMREAGKMSTSKPPSFLSSQPTTSSVFDGNHQRGTSRGALEEVSVVISEVTMELTDPQLPSAAAANAFAKRGGGSSPANVSDIAPPVLNLAVYNVPIGTSSSSLQTKDASGPQTSSPATTPHASSTVTLGSAAQAPSTAMGADTPTSTSNLLSTNDFDSTAPVRQPRTSTRKKLESRRLSLNKDLLATASPSVQSPFTGRRRSSTYATHTTNVPPSSLVAQGDGANPNANTPTQQTAPNKAINRARAATLSPQSSAPNIINQVDLGVFGGTTEESSSDHQEQEETANLPADLVKDERGRRPTLPSVPDMAQQLSRDSQTPLSIPSMMPLSHHFLPAASGNLSMFSSVNPYVFSNSARSRSESPFPTLSALTISMGGRETLRSGRSGLTFGKAFAAASSAVLSSTTTITASTSSPTLGSHLGTADPFFTFGARNDQDGAHTASSAATSQSIASNVPFGMGGVSVGLDSKSRSVSSVSLESRGRASRVAPTSLTPTSQMADGSASASRGDLSRIPSPFNVLNALGESRSSGKHQVLPAGIRQASTPSSAPFTSGIPSSGSAAADTTNTLTTDRDSVAALSTLSSRATTGLRNGGSASVATTVGTPSVSPPPYLPANTSFAGLSFPSASYSHSVEHTPGTGLTSIRAEAAVVSPIQFPHAAAQGLEEKSSTTQSTTTTAGSVSTNVNAAGPQPVAVTFIDSEPSGKAERVSSNGTTTSLVAFQGFQQRQRGRNSVYSTYTIGTGDFLPSSRRSSAVLQAGASTDVNAAAFVGISHSNAAQGSSVFGFSATLAASHSNVNLPFPITTANTASNTRNNSAVGAGPLGLDGHAVSGATTVTQSQPAAIHSISSGATSQTIRSESSGIARPQKIVELMESSHTPSSDKHFHGRVSSQTFAISPATNMILPHEGSVSIPSNISVGSAAYMSQNTVAGVGASAPSEHGDSVKQLHPVFSHTAPLGFVYQQRPQLLSVAAAVTSQAGGSTTARSNSAVATPASPLSATNLPGTAVVVPNLQRTFGSMGPRGSEFDPPLPNLKPVQSSTDGTSDNSKISSPNRNNAISTVDQSNSGTTLSTAGATVNSNSYRSHSSGSAFVAFAEDDSTPGAATMSRSNPLSNSNMVTTSSISPPLNAFASLVSEASLDATTTQSSHVPSVTVSAMTSHAALPTLLPSSSSRTHTTSGTTGSEPSASLLMTSNGIEKSAISNVYSVSETSTLIARSATESKLLARGGGGSAASPTRRHGSPIHHVSSPKRNLALTEDDIPFPVRGTKSAINLRQAAADTAKESDTTKTTTSSRISRRVVSLQEPTPIISQDPSFHGNFSSTMPAYDMVPPAIVLPLVPRSSAASFGNPTSSSGADETSSAAQGRDDSMSRVPIEICSIIETTSQRTEVTDVAGHQTGAMADNGEVIPTSSHTHIEEGDTSLRTHFRSEENIALDHPHNTELHHSGLVTHPQVATSLIGSITRSRSPTTATHNRDDPSSGTVTPPTDLSVFPPLMVVPSPLLAHANAPASSGDLHMTGHLTVSVSGISAPSHSHSMPHFGWSTNSGKVAHQPVAGATSLLISRPSLLSTESASSSNAVHSPTIPTNTPTGVVHVVQTPVPALTTSGSSGPAPSSVSSAFPPVARKSSDRTHTSTSNTTPVTLESGGAHVELDQPLGLGMGDASASMTNLSTVATTSMHTAPTTNSLRTTGGTSVSLPNRVASSRSMDSRVIGSLESFTIASNSNVAAPAMHFMNGGDATSNPFGLIPITSRQGMGGYAAANTVLPAVAVASVSVYHVSKSTFAGDEGLSQFATEGDGVQQPSPSITVSMPSMFGSSAPVSHNLIPALESSPHATHTHSIPTLLIDQGVSSPSALPLTNGTTVTEPNSADHSATVLQTVLLSDSMGGPRANSLSATRPPLSMLIQSLTHLSTTTAAAQPLQLASSFQLPSDASDCFDLQLEPNNRLHSSHHPSTSEQSSWSRGTPLSMAQTEAPRNPPSMSDSRLQSYISRSVGNNNSTALPSPHSGDKAGI